MVRSLKIWMEDVIRHIHTLEKARDFSGVEMRMNDQQSPKVEIDIREDYLLMCINLRSCWAGITLPAGRSTRNIPH